METAIFTIDAVFDAYFDCRRSKRNTINQLKFEADLEQNLVDLYHDLSDGSYQIGRSIAFVVTRPKIREVWAADFRDRVVHHLIYNAVFDRFHRRFIRDNYACIPGRGTHDGMRRVSGFARSITRNWSRSAYFLKADVANFFIDFTGFIIKPGRTYLRQATVDHCKQKIRAWERKGAPIDPDSLKSLSEGVNSYLGMLRQVSGYNARKKICKQVESLFLLSDAECTKIKPLV